MTSTERVKTICKERKIPISRLEKDCGFSNGYIGQLKKDLPLDRAIKIAEYLGVTIDFLTTGINSMQTNFAYFLDMQLSLLGYSIEYDSEGNVTLFYKDEAYEITDNDVRELRNSVSSYIQFKLQEIKSRSKKYKTAPAPKLRAARERTDIEYTEEDRAADLSMVDKEK